MSTLNWPLSILFSTLLLIPAAAQVSVAPGSEPPGVQPEAPPRGEFFDLHPRHFVRGFAREEYGIWASPFRRSSYNAHVVKKYLIPFALVTGALIASDRRSADFLPNTIDQTRWSGRVSQIGAGYTLAGISGATFLLGHISEDDHARETGLLALEALAHTQVVVFGIKQITNRRRPPGPNLDRGFWQGGNSFPSGHAASAFSVASVFAYEYHDRIAVPITAYALASVVSISRLSAQRHWFSDVFVGGSTGFLLGRYVYKKHHDNRLSGSPVQRTELLRPDFGVEPRGVTVAWHW